MKNLLTAFVITATSLTAFADHSLKDQMQNSKQVALAVMTQIKKAGVVCDTERSMQMLGKINGKAVYDSNGMSKAFRQVAFCYKTKKAMESDSETLRNGNEFGGIYALNASAILDVTYTYGSKTSSVIEISLK